MGWWITYHTAYETTPMPTINYLWGGTRSMSPGAEAPLLLLGPPQLLRQVHHTTTTSICLRGGSYETTPMPMSSCLQGGGVHISVLMMTMHCCHHFQLLCSTKPTIVGLPRCRS